MKAAIQIDLATLRPWPDVHRIISNMKSLDVVVGEVLHTGAANLSIDDAGKVTLSLMPRQAPPPEKPQMRWKDTEIVRSAELNADLDGLKLTKSAKKAKRT